jgi:hypothetical protein
MFIAGFCKVIADGSLMLQPALMGEMIRYVEGDGMYESDLWGYLLVIFMCVAALLRGWGDNHSTYIGYKCGMMVRLIDADVGIDII